MKATGASGSGRFAASDQRRHQKAWRVCVRQYRNCSVTSQVVSMRRMQHSKCDGRVIAAPLPAWLLQVKQCGEGSGVRITAEPLFSPQNLLALKAAGGASMRLAVHDPSLAAYKYWASLPSAKPFGRLALRPQPQPLSHHPRR
jgi:hypothetical protein